MRLFEWPIHWPSRFGSAMAGLFNVILGVIDSCNVDLQLHY
jgi:hypothetical protein